MEPIKKYFNLILSSLAKEYLVNRNAKNVAMVSSNPTRVERRASPVHQVTIDETGPIFSSLNLTFKYVFPHPSKLVLMVRLCLRGAENMGPGQHLVAKGIGWSGPGRNEIISD